MALSLLSVRGLSVKLIKSRDGTFKCECRVDFVIVHNGNVECSSCGSVAGRLSDVSDIRITKDTTDLSDSEIIKQIQFNNDLLHYLDVSLAGTMVSNHDKEMVKRLKRNIRDLKRIQPTS